MYKEITKSYGFVTRAKDFYLYTTKGVRLVDMYQEGGGAILGWRAGESKRVFKSFLDRGLIGSFPSHVEGQLERAIFNLIQHCNFVRWYLTKENAITALAQWRQNPYMQKSTLQTQNDLAQQTEFLTKFDLPVWRPWHPQNPQLENHTNNPNLSCVFSVCVPYPFKPSPVVLAFSVKPPQEKASEQVQGRPQEEAQEKAGEQVQGRPQEKAGEQAHSEVSESLQTRAHSSVNNGDTSEPPYFQPPCSDNVSPVLLAAMTRAIYDLIKEIPLRTEKGFARFDPYIQEHWIRKGPYLYPTCADSRYPDFFAACLDVGVFISPDYKVPSIVPYKADCGALKKLRTIDRY